LADYASLSAQVPGLADAGVGLASQITAEGNTAGLSPSQIADNIGAAHAQLADTFDNLVNSGGGFQLAIDTINGHPGAIDIATQAVVAARTTIGAVQGVVGLLSAASSATPAEVVAAGNFVVGTIIAAAVSAGAFSAGVGAVVVAGVALAGEALDALFGGSPPAAMVCGTGVSTVPTIVVGCAFSDAQPVAPGSPYWRHFPEPGQASDAGWFANGVSSGWGNVICFARWQPVATGPINNWEGASSSSPRLIDVAFSDYAQIFGQQTPVGVGDVLSDFKAAHFTAWKANHAFALNGMKVQPDYAVLFQTVRAWNAAHAPGNGGGLLLAPGNYSIGMNYEASLIEQIVSLSGGDTNIVNGALLIHTGAIHSPPKIVTLRLHGAAPAPATSVALSTTAKVALSAAILGGSAAAGVGVWAHVTGQGYVAAWSRVWGKSGGRLLKR
jgi:hypothetical protein